MGAKSSHPCTIGSDKKLFDELLWHSKNSKSTVRAPHQLEFLSKPGYCDFCRITKKETVKTKYTCRTCGLNFCFTQTRNDFKVWHSPECDHYRGYS